MKNGWQTKTLGEVCVVDKSQGIYSNLPYVGLEHIESHTGRFVGSTNPCSVKSSTFMFSPEHVLYGRLRPYLNKVMLPDFSGHCSTEIFPFKPRPGLSREFLQYWFLSDATVEKINATSTGTRMPRANMNAVLGFEFPFPPLSEQKRIVGVLDEALESVAIAKTNTEKNLKNARALFQSYLQSVFTARGDGWEESKLGDVCSIARGGSPRPIKKFITTASDGINWIKISDATASGKYIYKTKEKITSEGAKRSRIVHDGDFLLSNSMSFGRPYIMRTTGCIHDGWLVLSNYASHLDQDYLYLILNSQFVFQKFDRLAAGSTVRNLNIELASQVEIPVPSLKQQREIAKQLDTISAETQRLESIYQRELTELDALRKSLLNAAFSGKL